MKKYLPAKGINLVFCMKPSPCCFNSATVSLKALIDLMKLLNVGLVMSNS